MRDSAIRSSTNLFIGGLGSDLNADNVTINSAATVELSGGTLILDEESGTSLLRINAGGTLAGHGTITFADTPIAATTLLINDGTLTALSRGLTVLSPPPVGTLTINDSSVGGRVDLDGTSELGIVNVNRNQTLDLNVPLSDSFNGTMNLFQNSTFDSVSAWTMAGGALNVDNGAIAGIPAVPAGKSTIAGGTFTQSGGTINLVDADGTLQFDAAFNMNGGTLTNNGLVIFNANATIAAAANFNMAANNASFTVGAGRTVQIQQTNFNMDGPAVGTSVITINTGGVLNVTSNDYDSDSLINAYNGVINLNGGAIVTNTGDATFVMDGVLNMDSSGGGAANWSGEPLAIGNDGGVLNADLNVLGGQFNELQSNVTFNSDADVDIAAGSRLRLIGTATATFNTVNGGNNAEFTGAGTLEFNNAINFNEAVTFNMSGGTINLTGADATGATASVDAPVVVNVANFGSYGNVNSAGGPDTLDIDARTAGTSGKLTVNLGSAIAEWNLNPAAVLNLSAPNGGATLLAGSDVNLNGTVNALGGVVASARVDIGGLVNIQGSSALNLLGGNFADPNTLVGGTVSGPGNFSASSGRALRGFGTIITPVLFTGTAALLAQGGTLTVNGPITDVGTIGTFDASGILNVSAAWNTNVADFVSLNGGELKGGTINNGGAGGISGKGLISSRVINGISISANGGAALIVQTAGNDNDWDGAGNNGSLNALGAGSVLELRDNAAFGFTGTVSASTGGRVFSNGFALDFNPGSSIQLQDSTYESTNSTDIGGTLQTQVGATQQSTIKVAVNNFLTFQSTSATTLGQNLRLENNNIRINAGATFAGPGAIIIPDNSHLIPDNSANINTLLVNEGTIRIAGFDMVGLATVKDYQQSDTGELFVEIAGTALNQYDRLAVNGQALLDGYLNIDIDGVFPLTLGTTFNIITASSGVFGTFNQVDNSGMPPGLTFHINYLPFAVQLQVVSTPFFSADFDHDGDVDQMDYSIWKNAFGLNQLGDANGDGLSNAADYTLWRNQLGGAPGAGSGGSSFDIGSIAVPEPTSAALMAICAMLAGYAGRRR